MKRILLATLFVLGISTIASAASIKGTAVYDGKVPKFREIKMAADPMCAAKHSDSVFPETLVIGDPESKTMGNVLIYLSKGVPSGKHAPKEEAVIDQAGCMYTPHVMGVMVDQEIKILNPDGTLHNVHAIPKINDEFNIAMPKFRKEMKRTFNKAEAEPFPVKCDVHPWMVGYVGVFEHPFFDVTAPDGMFEIADLSAGTYEVTAWHEKLGVQTSMVEVVEGDAEVNFTFTRPTKK